MATTEADLLTAVRRVADRTDGYVTYAAVAAELGLAKSGVYRRLQVLAEKGYIAISEGRGGGIKLLDRTNPTELDGTVRLAVDVAFVAGQPVAVRLVE